MNLSSFFFLLSFILLLPFQSIQAEVYRWKDKNGKIHFSDKPHANATQLDIKAPKPSGIGISNQQVQRRKALLDEFEENRNNRKTQDLKEKNKKKAIDRYCRQLKNQLQNYKDVDYLYTRDEAGERINLSDTKKQAEEAKLRHEIEERC